MEDRKRDFRSFLKSFAGKAAKATIKGLLVYLIYLVIMSFLSPAAELVPGFQFKALIETLVTIYIVLMIIGSLCEGTIFQYFFGGAKALFVISYVIWTLNGGIVSLSFESISLMVDLRLFLVITMLLGLLGLTKSVLQALNYMNEKAEHQAMLAISKP